MDLNAFSQNSSTSRISLTQSEWLSAMVVFILSLQGLGLPEPWFTFLLSLSETNQLIHPQESCNMGVVMLDKKQPILLLKLTLVAN